MKAAGVQMGHPPPDVVVDGEVIEADPPHRLVQTWRMLMDELEGAPKLAVLLSGGMEETGAGGGWSWVLSDLKTLLETGGSLDPQDGLNQG